MTSFGLCLTSNDKESEMARGKKCPCCGMAMFAQREDDQDRGRWVTYVCQNNACEKCGRGSKARCNHTEKVFEDYAC